MSGVRCGNSRDHGSNKRKQYQFHPRLKLSMPPILFVLKVFSSRKQNAPNSGTEYVSDPYDTVVSYTDAGNAVNFLRMNRICTYERPVLTCGIGPILNGDHVRVPCIFK